MLIFITIFLLHNHLVHINQHSTSNKFEIDLPGKEYLLKRKLVIEKFKPNDIPDIEIYKW